MAVDGRKGIIAQSETEQFRGITQNCGPCETDEEYVGAHGYCVDCQDYLCLVCFKSHGRNKASAHHKRIMLDEIRSADISQSQVETCSNICSKHEKEYIKFFCIDHKTLGCNDCMTLSHRTCTLDYIPEKCKGILDSSECRTTVNELEQEIKQINKLILEVNVKDGLNECMFDQCVKDVNTFQAQINEQIDHLRKQIQNAAADERLKNKENLKQARNSLHARRSTLEQAVNDVNKYKTTQEDLLFISMKRAQAALEERKEVKEYPKVKADDIMYKFEPNHQLNISLLTEQNIIGKIQHRSLESDDALESVANGIVVLNVPEDATEEDVKTYFESTTQSQGGKTVIVDVHSNESYSIVSFQDQTDVLRVCHKEDHVIVGKQVDVHPCLEFLGAPYSFSPDDFDQNVLKFLNGVASKRIQVETELSKCQAKILWSSDPPLVTSVLTIDGKHQCDLSESWKYKAKQAIKKFTDGLYVEVFKYNDAIPEDVFRALHNVELNNPDDIAIYIIRKSCEIKMVYDKGFLERDLNKLVKILTTSESYIG